MHLIKVTKNKPAKDEKEQRSEDKTKRTRQREQDKENKAKRTRQREQTRRKRELKT